MPQIIVTIKTIKKKKKRQRNLGQDDIKFAEPMMKEEHETDNDDGKS